MPRVELPTESRSTNWQYPNDQVESAIEDASVNAWVCELLRADLHPTKGTLLAALSEAAFGLSRKVAERVADRSLMLVRWARARASRITTGVREQGRRPGLLRVVRTMRAQKAKHGLPKGVVLPEQALNYIFYGYCKGASEYYESDFYEN